MSLKKKESGYITKVKKKKGEENDKSNKDYLLH